MPFCSCKDIEIYFEAHGQGEPLLLVSGLSGGTWSWYGQVPFFQSHYRAIVFDNRGAGRSSIPPGPYRMEQFAEDALCLLDHLGVEKAFVMGLSMGGMIAQELVLTAPERVRALLLGCTHCGGNVRIPPSPEVLQLLMRNDGLDQRQIIEKNLPLFFSEQCRRARPDVIEAYCNAQLLPPLQPEPAFHAQLAAIGSFDASERLLKVQVPTLIVTGTEDVLVPPGNSTRLRERIPGSRMVEITGAGHAIHAEARNTLNGLAHEFFQEHPD